MDARDRRRRAAQEAAEWWVLLEGEVSRTQREQYVDWLRESALHVAEMMRMAQVRGAVAQFERWVSLPTDGSKGTSSEVVPLTATATPVSSPPPKNTPRRLKMVSAVAATVLGVVGAALWLYLLRGQVIQTERGERREVALADGSVVQIDPESRLRINYGPQLRRVYLERGRALFHVVKDAQRPFFVSADDTTVRAVGTAFGVEEGQDRVVITVAEGRVAVFPARGALASEFNRKPVATPGGIANPLSSGSATRWRGDLGVSTNLPGGTQGAPAARSSGATGEILLTANEQITVSESGSAEPVREVDSHRALAWAEGRLIFESESVEHAVQQFNRYNRIQLNIRDDVLAHRAISGVFSAEDPESFVAFIQSVAVVRVTRDDEANITIDTR